MGDGNRDFIMITYPRKCHTCGKKEVVPATHTTIMDQKHNGQTYSFEVKDMPVLKCANCSEIYYGNDSEDHVQKTFLEHLKTFGIHTVKLFVYGTLKPYESNYHKIKHAVCWTQPGTVKGTLLDFGAFPGLTQRGIDDIEGYVFDLEESALAITDEIEGYYPSEDRPCMYLRRKITVFLGKDAERNDIKIEAWTYIYTHPERMQHATHITNWRKHRHESNTRTE